MHVLVQFTLTVNKLIHNLYSAVVATFGKTALELVLETSLLLLLAVDVVGVAVVTVVCQDRAYNEQCSDGSV